MADPDYPQRRLRPIATSMLQMTPQMAAPEIEPPTVRTVDQKLSGIGLSIATLQAALALPVTAIPDAPATVTS